MSGLSARILPDEIHPKVSETPPRCRVRDLNRRPTMTLFRGTRALGLSNVPFVRHGNGTLTLSRPRGLRGADRPPLMRAHHTASGNLDAGDHPRLGPRHQPASVTLAGYTAEEVPSTSGLVDLKALEAAWATVGDSCSPIPILSGCLNGTPRSPRWFTRSAGCYTTTGELQLDRGIVRPGDMGFDIVHLNCTRRSRNSRGRGARVRASGVSKELDAIYRPRCSTWDEGAEPWRWDYDRPDSIGRIHHGTETLGSRPRLRGTLGQTDRGSKTRCGARRSKRQLPQGPRKDAYPTAFPVCA